MANCVCCEQETKGMYEDKFPVCYGCYAGKDFKLNKLFYALVNRHTMKLNHSLNENIEAVNNAADEWYNHFRKVE